MFTVITESKGWSISQPFVVTRTFDDRDEALDWIAEELCGEDVLRVRCPEIDFEDVPSI